MQGVCDPYSIRIASVPTAQHFRSSKQVGERGLAAGIVAML